MTELLDLDRAYAFTTGSDIIGKIETTSGYWTMPSYTYYHSCCHFSEDKGKKAFEIVKMLQEKKILKLKEISEFIDTMDCLLKIL